MKRYSVKTDGLRQSPIAAQFTSRVAAETAFAMACDLCGVAVVDPALGYDPLPVPRLKSGQSYNRQCGCEVFVSIHRNF